jgi:hypothetical protein
MPPTTRRSRQKVRKTNHQLTINNQLTSLEQTTQYLQELEATIQGRVVWLRLNGVSWQRIATALDMTAGGCHKRYAAIAGASSWSNFQRGDRSIAGDSP